MNSKSKDPNRLFFQSDDLRFFRAVINQSLTNGRLYMPNMLVRQHRDAFTNPLKLRIANQVMWRVDLVVDQSSGLCWIQGGFERFLRYYDIRDGYILLFEHEKNGKYFDVKIFSKNASEIEYPLNITIGGDMPQEDEPSDSDSDSDGRVVNLSPPKYRTFQSRSTETSTRIGGSKPQKMKKRGPLVNLTSPEIVYPPPSEEEMRRRQNRIELKPYVGHKSDTGRPFFAMTMSPTYLYPIFMLGVPADFAREHFRSSGGSVLLCDKDGRKWKAKYYNKVFEGKVKARIFKGWKHFVLANDLEEGDACVFELFDSQEVDVALKIEVLRQGQGLHDLIGMRA